jgi:hypothetical protein
MYSDKKWFKKIQCAIAMAWFAIWVNIGSKNTTNYKSISQEVSKIVRFFFERLDKNKLIFSENDYFMSLKYISYQQKLKQQVNPLLFFKFCYKNKYF